MVPIILKLLGWANAIVIAMIIQIAIIAIVGSSFSSLRAILLAYRFMIIPASSGRIIIVDIPKVISPKLILIDNNHPVLHRRFIVTNLRWKFSNVKKFNKEHGTA